MRRVLTLSSVGSTGASARRARAVLAVASVILGAALALVSPTASAESGHLGVYFDTSAHVTFQDVSPFVGFQLYVIADFGESRAPIGSEMSAWDARLDVDSRVTVTGRQYHPSSALDFASGPDDFLVGLGVHQPTSNSPLLLLTYECIVLGSDVTDAGVQILDDATTDEFAGIGPAWAEGGDDRDGQQHGFESWSGALINPRENLQSWGEMKNSFGDSR